MYVSCHQVKETKVICWLIFCEKEFFLYDPLTFWAPMPQNGQTHLTCRQIADELFESLTILWG